MYFKSRILLAGAASLMLLAACNSHKVSGPVAATVNGEPIGEKSVDLIMKQRAAQGQPDTPEARKEILDHMTMQLLLVEAAVKKGLDKSPEVMDHIELTRQSILANAFVEDYVKNNPVTDEMIAEDYKKFSADMSGNEYKARHILVDKESEAKDIIAKLKKDPKAFEALAKEKSKDPGSKANGGDLGWFNPHSMVPEFSAATAKLSKGQITQEPVKSQFGYHVILLEDTRPIQVPSLEQVKPSMKNQIQQKNIKKLLDDMKASAKIEIMQPQVAPAAPAPQASSPAPAPAASAPAASAAPADAKPAASASK